MIYKQEPAGFDSQMEVSSCIMEHDGKLLLLLRHDHKPEGNTWSTPAGKVEAGETSLETIVREVREETGCQAAPEDFIFFQTYFVRYPERDFIYHRYQLPLADEPEIVLETSAHKDFRWATPEEAIKLTLIPGEEACIRDFYNS